jgi:hypothetical protein
LMGACQRDLELSTGLFRSDHVRSSSLAAFGVSHMARESCHSTKNGSENAMRRTNTKQIIDTRWFV